MQPRAMAVDRQAHEGEQIKEEPNLAAYVCGINNLKIQPFKLPSTLG